MGKRPNRRFRTSSGHRPRARLHGEGGPVWRRVRRRVWVRNLLVVVGAVLALGIAASAYAQQWLASLPSVRGLSAANFQGGDVVITDRNGIVLADIGNNGNHRLIVPLNKISPWMIKATVAVEDKNFYSNSGFDPTGIVRAALTDYRSGALTSGGSTITQQLAKQLFLSPDRTWQRKVKELALAYELTQNYSKDQILELYFNWTYYGSQAYGVQAAAQTYFQKDAADLDLAQAAMLSGLPKAPSDYDPVLHADAAKARQQQVLDAMVHNGYITAATEQAALAEPLNIKPPVNTNLAPHFVDYVKEELHTLGFDPGGEQVVVQTTLDLKTQQIAEKVVRQNLLANKYRDPNGRLQSAMVAMDPRTSQILAMVGSYDYNNSPGGQYNLADLPRNPGSSIKVFTYAAALNAKKATMETRILDDPSRYYPPGYGSYYVTNYTGRGYGWQPLKYTFPNSLNISAVKVELAVGIPNVVAFDRNVGVYPRGGPCICETDANPASYGPPLTLGSSPITLVEEANGLSTIADLGVYHAPEAVLKISDSTGKVLYTANPEKTRRQAFDAGAAFIEGQILSNNQNRALVFGLNTPLHLNDRRAAAKTGTTDNFKDALTIGYTPTLASVFWVGDIGPLNSTMVDQSDGVYVAAPAWHDFMEQALKGVPDQWYQAPPDVVQKGSDYFLLDAQDIPVLGQPHPTPNPSPSPTGPTIIYVTPTYKIPSPPAGEIAQPSPEPTPSASPCVGPPGQCP